MNIYILRNTKMLWGDYGDILLSGMTGHLERKDGLLQLERTGPFVPPITESGIGEIVVTDFFKKELEKSGLTGFTFKPVIKKHIVYLDWLKWDKNNEEPEEYPKTGEPEDYILSRPHSPELAQKIGDIWEMCIEYCGDAEVKKDKVYYKLNTWDGRDWFKAKGVEYIYISEKAKQWLEEKAPQWISFEKALTK